MDYDNQNGSLVCCKCNRYESVDRVVEIDGKIYCKSCLADFSRGPKHAYSMPHHSSSRGDRPFISKVILFLLSFTIPGVNYMYMGLVKKGLSFIIAFFACALVTGTFHIWQLGFAIPILYIYTFFDGFAKRRLLESGVVVPDDASELSNFFNNYKVPLVLIIGVLFVVNAFNNFYYHMRFAYDGIGRPLFMVVSLALGVVIVIYGMRTLFGRKDKKDIIDTRKNGQDEDYR